MKKIFIRFFYTVLTVVCLAGVFVFSGCAVEVGTLSETTAAAITRLYYEQNYEEIERLEELTGTKIAPAELVESMDYLGNYNGCDVVLVKLSIVEGVSDSVIKVDGVELGIFSAGKTIGVYNAADNSLESIYEAYSAGKIYKHDLKKIKKVCKQQGYSKTEAVAV